MDKQKIICIMGPTAVGKTDLALKLAKKLNGYIISADSMQVYKHLDIGTAKETPEELASVKHYLIDNLDPSQKWNAGLFQKEASRIIKENKDQTAIIVGGTGLYVKGLIYPFNFGKSSSDNSIRDKYEKLLELKGEEFIFNQLLSTDPESTKHLNIHEHKKIIRALEIFETTGKTKTQLITEQHNNPEFDSHIIILNNDREVIYSRINRRVDIMLKNGLLEEVKHLKNNDMFNELSREAIGYKQLISYLNNECTYEYAVDKIKQLSRNYAKRQITFFKSFDTANWYNSSTQVEEAMNDAIEFINKKM